MTEMKRKLHRLIKAGRAREELSLLRFVSDQAGLPHGRWSAKDHLAHLASWREFAAEEVLAVITGAEPRPVSEDLDLENAKIFERTHDQPATEIMLAGGQSWAVIASAVEACTESDLHKPGVRRPAQRLWQVIQLNTTTHLAGHLGFWFGDQGDRAAAEGSAKWGYELAKATFTDDRARGAAAYNLGCFYALRGQAEESVRFLFEGIQLRPDLYELAKHDSDLDPIRSSPEFQAMID
jgi:hypothetical protein